ncbi:MAG: ImmA/IrrE family metallo-endopeptidase [Candidatus Sedimenticola sp. (ex Thyasira tokunagai)]
MKLIKTEQDHCQAMERLAVLMSLDPIEGSEEADELDVLALLIQQFEEQCYPMDKPDPIDAILFRMDQMDLTRKDMQSYLGPGSRVSDVLNRKRPLSLSQIRRLIDGLGISADVLIQEPNAKLPTTLDIEWQAFPLNELNKKGYFPGFEGTSAYLKEFAEDMLRPLLAFLPEEQFAQVPAQAYLRSSAHRRGNDKLIDPLALLAWQAQVLKQSEGSLASYIKPDLPWLTQLAGLSQLDNGPLLARELLGKRGIFLVVEPHLDKTYLDGAVMSRKDGAPVIALTLRHDRMDNFWFTLFHELAHLMLHFDAEHPVFFDDLDCHDALDRIEFEADDLAQAGLIDPMEWKQAVFSNTYDIQTFAQRNNIHPAIVAGRLCFEDKGRYKQFGHLRGNGQVRKLFRAR